MKETAVTLPEDRRMPQRLLALAQRSAAPRLTEAWLSERFGPRSHWQPAAGQLWRAVHSDATALVLLVYVDAESVTAIPATTGSMSTSDEVVVVERTAFGVPVTVWASLRRTLPVSILDRPVDDLGADVVHRATQVPPRDLHQPGVDFGDGDTEVRAELLDDLIELAESIANSAKITSQNASQPLALDLDAIDASALDEAARRIGGELPALLDLIDGKRPATPEQASVMRELLGAAPAPAAPPSALVIELGQPRWRGLVRQHQRSSERDEDAARKDLAYLVGAMAARQTGDVEPSWPDRIRRWAQAHQLDPDADR